MRLKQSKYLLIDILIVAFALCAAFLLRFGTVLPLYGIELFAVLLPIALFAKILVFYLFGFYGQLWQYASLKEGLRLLRGISAASLILLGILFFIQIPGVPRAILIIDWLITLCLVSGARLVARIKKELFNIGASSAKPVRRRVIIIGAGEAGTALVKQMQQHPEKGYVPVALLDDNPVKRGLMIHGVKVVGNTRSIPSVLATYPADEIVLAIPSAAEVERRRIAFECQELGVACKTVPDIVELVDGQINLSQIRDIDPKELLGRKEIDTSLKRTAAHYRDKVILITGAAGSIGSELCSQVLALKPELVIATDISENGLYHLEEKLRLSYGASSTSFETRLLDVRDAGAAERLFRECRPTIVFHAAAYKHVPMMERHVIEAMENNFIGTRVMIEIAQRYEPERFILVSTDKAVNPTNIMGLSKQFAEHAIKVAASHSGKTKYMAVRFGNVLGSNGSVIPKFKRQINSGQAVTVTHPDVTRYFMTIHEAVYLVIHATTMGKGGEIFVLNMGEPVRILDLARSMIRLSGFEPGKDIPITFIGLRPGEKMHEELFDEDEAVSTTKHSQIVEVRHDLDAAEVRFLHDVESATEAGEYNRLARLLAQNHSATTDCAIVPRVDELFVGEFIG